MVNEVDWLMSHPVVSKWTNSALLNSVEPFLALAQHDHEPMVHYKTETESPVLGPGSV
jgi:hypothetical protein